MQSHTENAFFNQIFEREGQGYALREDSTLSIDGILGKGTSFEEIYDYNRLAYIVNNFDRLYGIISEKRENIHSGCILAKYAQSSRKIRGMKGSTRMKSVEYNQTQFKARYTAKQSLSMQAMIREFKQAICSKFYKDIDMKNAHPCMLVWLCEILGEPCGPVIDYIENREKHFDDILEINAGVSRDDAKGLFLRIQYGCGQKSRNNWDHADEKPQKTIVHTAFSKEYIAFFESLKKRSFLERAFPSFYASYAAYRREHNKEYNVFGGALSTLMQYIENKALMLVVRKLQAKPKTEPFAKSIVLCFDGLMIRKSIKRASFNFESFIEEVNRMFAEQGIPHIKMAVKEMDSQEELLEGYDEKVEYTVEQDVDKIIAEQDAENQDKKLPVHVALKKKLLAIVQGTYRRERHTGAIYREETSYYYKQAYASPEAFLNKIFLRDEQYTYSTERDRMEVIKFICSVDHPDFPFIEIDANYIGYTNGVFDLQTAKLLTGEDIPEGIQVRKMFDTDFQLVDTPMLDKLLNSQFSSEKDIEYAYFTMGRTLTVLNDRFDFMLMLHGQSGSGKSVLATLIKKSFDEQQVGILSRSLEEKFGLRNFVGKQLVVCDDMPHNISKHLDRGDFLAMMSRGCISCPEKGKAAVLVHDWNIPTIINSNNLPNYKDVSGEIVRRIQFISFRNVIPEEERDLQLESKILATEHATFLWRCRSTYLRFCEEHAGEDVRTFAPESFLESSREFRMEANTVYNFAISKLDDVPYDASIKEMADGDISFGEMSSYLRTFVNELFCREKSREKLDAAEILRAHPQAMFVRAQYCRHCDCLSKKGCCDKYDPKARVIRRYFKGLTITERSMDEE